MAWSHDGEGMGPISIIIPHICEVILSTVAKEKCKSAEKKDMPNATHAPSISASAASRTAIHLYTSSISLAGSVPPLACFAPHIFNKRMMLAVNAGSCKEKSAMFWTVIESRKTCLEMQRGVL